MARAFEPRSPRGCEVLHWTGPLKPWRHHGVNRKLWEPYAREPGPPGALQSLGGWDFSRRSRGSDRLAVGWVACGWVARLCWSSLDWELVGWLGFLGGHWKSPRLFSWGSLDSPLKLMHKPVVSMEIATLFGGSKKGIGGCVRARVRTALKGHQPLRGIPSF